MLHRRQDVVVVGWCVCAASCSLCANGCVSADERQPVPFEDAPAFSSSGEQAPDPEWWQSFDDPALDARISRALSNNFTLGEAWARLRAASATADVERSALMPSVDGVATGVVRDGSDVDQETELSLGLEASYEVDLWGRIRAAVEADELRAAASAEDLRAAAVTLSAEVALAWYGLVESRLQLELIASQLQTNETVLEVLEERFAVGQSGSPDVLRQRQLVEATREQAVIERTRAAVLRNRLAVLEGRPPQEDAAYREDQPPMLPEVPGLPRTGLPSELVVRRPDIRAATLLLEASDRDVAEAVRDQYPRIDLMGVLRTAAESPAGLFDRWLASLAGELIAPLYDGGRRRAEIERRVALRRAALAQYGQSVLDAFGEVEDALVQEKLQLERIELLREQLRLAETTTNQLRTLYLNGATDFIDLLTALRERQTLERDLLSAGFDRIRFRISLHRALAGGFDLPEPVYNEIRSGVTGEQ